MIAGLSAGAQLALWSAMRDRLSPGSAVSIPDPLLPKAVVAIDGPGALTEFVGKDAEICDKPVIVPVMGGTPQQFPQRYLDASPQDHLPLHVHQSFAQAASPIDAAIHRSSAHGSNPVTTHRPEKTGHFTIINPTLPQGQGKVALIEKAVTLCFRASQVRQTRVKLYTMLQRPIIPGVQSNLALRD